jgi:hypothetical protein
MCDAQGDPVSAAPQSVRLAVRIRSDGAPASALQALVVDSRCSSPIPSAVSQAVPVHWQIDAG